MSDISELHYNSLVLKDFHIKTASYKHAIQEVDEKWELFIPTHFVYEFFIFNTLYSIDWEQSLNNAEGIIENLVVKEVLPDGKRKYYGEEEKQKLYLDFIFNDGSFIKLYNDNFRKLFFLNRQKENIKGILERITPDRYQVKKNNNIEEKSISQIKSDRGNVSKKVCDGFNKAIKDIINNKPITKEYLNDIITFIYKVRCNIFHGVKCFEELNSGFEREKLAFYSNILIAVNQMLFSYLDYLKNNEEGTEENSFQELWEKLAKK